MSLSLLLWICHNQTKILKAPSNEGASLVSATPPSGRHRGRVLVTVGYQQPEREGYRAASECVSADLAWDKWVRRARLAGKMAPVAKPMTTMAVLRL